MSRPRTGAAGGLCAALILLAACGGRAGAPPARTAPSGDGPSPAPGSGGPPPVVMIVDTAFEPAQLTVPVGAAVTWKQTGQQPHSATSATGVFDSSPGCGPIAPEACLHAASTYAFTFTRPGTYPFYCRVHGLPSGEGMTGTIVVR